MVYENVFLNFATVTVPATIFESCAWNYSILVFALPGCSVCCSEATTSSCETASSTALSCTASSHAAKPSTSGHTWPTSGRCRKRWLRRDSSTNRPLPVKTEPTALRATSVLCAGNLQTNPGMLQSIFVIRLIVMEIMPCLINIALGLNMNVTHHNVHSSKANSQTTYHAKVWSFSLNLCSRGSEKCYTPNDCYILVWFFQLLLQQSMRICTTKAHTRYGVLANRLQTY